MVFIQQHSQVFNDTLNFANESFDLVNNSSGFCQQHA